MLRRAFSVPRYWRMKLLLSRRDTSPWMSGQETWNLKASHPVRFIYFPRHGFPRAHVPEHDRLIMALLLPFALFLATGTVVLIDFFDPRIHNGIDVEQILGFSPIGSLFNDQDVIHAGVR